MLKYVLLGFLSYRPMTGYDLENWMAVSTANFWHARLSQIYTALKNMESEELVISHIEPQEGRPDRRVYHITDAGRDDLQGWLSEPLLEMPVKKDTLLVKVFFGLFADRSALLTQLRLQLELHRQQKAHYQNETPQDMSAFIADQPEVLPHAVLWDMTRRYGEIYEDTYMTWLQETIVMIEQLDT